MKKIAERIKKVLLNSDKSRSSDRVLIANVWHADIKRMGKDPNFMTAYELLQLLIDGKLSNVETIRRVRQRLQEENPQFRGTNYKKRQELQDTIVSEVRTIDPTTQTNLFP